MDRIIIREIEPKDNEAIAKVIRAVLIEHQVPKTGTAYADPQLDYMFEAYSDSRSVYFVAEKNGKIIGGAGISQLENSKENICVILKRCRIWKLPKSFIKNLVLIILISQSEIQAILRVRYGC
jgi:putative acetyltransferase